LADLYLWKNWLLGSIKLKNIRVFAYHGCLAEEGKIGSDYRVDLKVKGDLSHSAKTDALADTIDYVHLNKIVKQEMAIRSKLLETVAERILKRVLEEILLVQKVKVEVSKINPPIGGNVAMVSVIRSKSR
jgi:dihydroneopterin aldolase